MRTYQTKSGLASGNHKVRAWVRNGGGFNIARLQAKTCSGCAPAYTHLGTYGDGTQVEAPVIAVTGGYLELGLHSQLIQGNGASYIDMDDVELIRL